MIKAASSRRVHFCHSEILNMGISVNKRSQELSHILWMSSDATFSKITEAVVIDARPSKSLLLDWIPARHNQKAQRLYCRLVLQYLIGIIIASTMSLPLQEWLQEDYPSSKLLVTRLPSFRQWLCLLMTSFWPFFGSRVNEFRYKCRMI